jgi:hypothetical protein
MGSSRQPVMGSSRQPVMCQPVMGSSCHFPVVVVFFTAGQE